MLQAQNPKKQLLTETKTLSDEVVMTWDKNTPESEMNDDVKALKGYGVTITYSDVKRNANKEITGLKVGYTDDKGNSGELTLNHKDPIPKITFYKLRDKVGFGQEANRNPFDDFFTNGITDKKEIKKFRFHDEEGNPTEESFNYNFSDEDEMPRSKSKIIIIKPNKKDLIIEDGKILSGEGEYSPEEIEKIKKEHEAEIPESKWGDKEDFIGELDLRNPKGMAEIQKKMEKFIRPQFKDSDEKAELQQAKEEMVKAREALEKARLELEKAIGAKKSKK